MNDKAFYDAIRSSLFNGGLTRSQVLGIQSILEAFEKYGDGDLENLAYILATAYHETGRRMVPVREGFARTDAAARAAVRRAGRRYAQEIGGQVYYGRGHVQLTWLANYRQASEDLGLDLVGNPDLALRPDISAALLVDGILGGKWNAAGHGIEHYLGGPGAADDDMRGARRTVNVTDRWELIGGYYRKFRAALEAAGYGAAPEKPGAPPTGPVPGGGTPVPPLTPAAAGALAAWLGRAPADPRVIGAWLAALPEEVKLS